MSCGKYLVWLLVPGPGRRDPPGQYAVTDSLPLGWPATEKLVSLLKPPRRNLGTHQKYQFFAFIYCQVKTEYKVIRGITTIDLIMKLLYKMNICMNK